MDRTPRDIDATNSVPGTRVHPEPWQEKDISHCWNYDANPLWKRKNLLFKNPVLVGITALRETVWRLGHTVYSVKAKLSTNAI